MKVIALNGSPRKTWNTSLLLQSALDGAAAKGAETKLIHLYDLDFKGCVSCFACKKIGGESYGHCGYKDGLTPVLKEIETCDGLLLGSPIYLGDVTGEMRSLLERLVFPYIAYSRNHPKLFTGQFKTGFIYTMNVGGEHLEKVGYKERFGGNEAMMGRIFGPAESLYVTDTLQFDDYSKYVTDMFDVEARQRRRREVFPEDLRKAREMGARLVD
jgi:multimeric flavodoxin WrbA